MSRSNEIPGGAAALLLSIVCSALPAAGVASITSLPSALALEAASAARGACAKLGYTVAVTVVDAAGHVLVTLRDDRAAPHTGGTSQRKAYTALTLRKPTEEVAKTIANQPTGAGLRDIDGLLILGGGLPIRARGLTIGGIGVSGVPNDHGDETCAAAGIAAIAAKLEASN